MQIISAYCTPRREIVSFFKIKSPVKDVTNYQYQNEPADPSGQTRVGSRCNHEQNTSNGHNKLLADDSERRLPAPLPGVVREQ